MSAQQLTLFAPETTECDRLNRSLNRALHSFCDADIRWAKRKDTGLTDLELKECIRYEFGIFGGCKSSSIDCMYQGGSVPKFWADGSWPGKPTLQGNTLVSKTRELLNIPYP